MESTVHLAFVATTSAVLGLVSFSPHSCSP